MKFRYIILSLFSLSLFSCDTRDEYINALNVAPSVSFVKNSEKVTSLKDSMKVSLKNSQKKYSFNLSISDVNNNISEVKFLKKLGEGSIKQDNEVRADIIDYTGEDIILSYEPATKGTHLIEFSATDKFKSTSVGSLELFAFDNFIPVGRISYKNIGVLSQYEYELDASGSYDTDANFGGAISLYKFRINDDEVLTKNSKINYIFSGPGNHLISIEVQDNDGAWSTLVSEVVNL